MLDGTLAPEIPADAMVFQPREGDWRSRQLLSAEAAGLLASLQSPAPLDTRRLGARTAARLVLDGLLEIRVGGRYRSGGAAHRLFFPHATSGTPRGALARLSHRALTAVAALGPLSPAETAVRLYRYNTLPWSAARRRQLPDDAAAARFHGLDDAAIEIAAGHTVRRFQSGPWEVWQHDTSRTGTRNGPTWKLYLSPLPRDTALASQALLAWLGRRGGPMSVKVGRTIAATLRPDRIVGYFPSRAALEATARSLGPTLTGLPMQGVPFTAAIAGSGLMSWGADFPTTTALPPMAMERSWRGWITIRLGGALAVALASGAVDPVAAAIDRVSLDGVNTTSWAPSEALLRSVRPGEEPDADL